jgi:hypothetical protein
MNTTNTRRAPRALQLRDVEHAFQFHRAVASLVLRETPGAAWAMKLQRWADANLAKLQPQPKAKGRLLAVNEDGRRIGESHPRAKLSNADLDRVFELRDSGLSPKQIADEVGISRRHVDRLLNCTARNHTPASWRREGVAKRDDAVAWMPGNDSRG